MIHFSISGAHSRILTIAFPRDGGRPRLYNEFFFALGVGFGYEQNAHAIKDEHQEKIKLRLAGRAGEFFPGEDSPKRGDHGGGLADGVGDGDSREAGGDEIEDHAGAPDESAEKA